MNKLRIYFLLKCYREEHFWLKCCSLNGFKTTLKNEYYLTQNWFTFTIFWNKMNKFYLFLVAKKNVCTAVKIKCQIFSVQLSAIYWLKTAISWPSKKFVSLTGLYFIPINTNECTEIIIWNDFFYFCVFSSLRLLMKRSQLLYSCQKDLSHSYYKYIFVMIRNLLFLCFLCFGRHLFW